MIKKNYVILQLHPLGVPSEVWTFNSCNQKGKLERLQFVKFVNGSHICNLAEYIFYFLFLYFVRVGGGAGLQKLYRAE